MEPRQLHAPADPGFRLDLDGRAHFLYEGYTVSVQVRRTTPEDVLNYHEYEYESDEVVMAGAVTLEGIDVGAAWAVANERDVHDMREALERVLRETVDDLRHTVARLSARVEETDRKCRA